MRVILYVCMYVFVCLCVCVSVCLCLCVCVRLQLPVSGRSVPVCDDASFRLHCESDDIMSLRVTWAARLSDIPTSDLPDLHDLGQTAGITRGALKASDVAQRSE